ncbi:two component transcriptional regulator, winged helix family [Desulfovibrio sp. DV]|uniref:response regulator n=1 Tax=Desulfovibrio sp. DV TaxID=1844708 RepID=UPI00094B7D72|nr:response regulator transcription factor [Desulfovibrio sp. DV]OLN28845.1 two component transcriptional regulator, winged helix family [Desulfovibrio sp. DV]
MGTKRILVIEDDRRLQDLLREYLATFGFEVKAVGHAREGLDALEAFAPALVILDLMLPDIDGFEACREIRRRGATPIIMLTARTDVADRVAGLEIGADDYVPKPFEPRELVARIQAVLRRGEPAQAQPAGESLSFGRLRVDRGAREAFLDEVPLGLTTTEFEALSLLAGSAGRVLDRDALLRELRGLESDVYNRSIDIAMSRLRQKLGDDAKAPTFIKTVRGAGYVFIAKADDHA